MYAHCVDSYESLECWLPALMITTTPPAGHERSHGDSRGGIVESSECVPQRNDVKVPCCEAYPAAVG